MDWLTSFNAPSSAVAVLTAMITPAVLISACGTLVLSTSTRLARVLDRVRSTADSPQVGERLELIGNLVRRARLLQVSLALFYLGISSFVATSMSIGIVAAGASAWGWVPIVTALLGALMLLAGSLLLIVESNLALRTALADLRLPRG